MLKTLPPLDTIKLDTPLRLSVAAAVAFPDGSMTASGPRRESACMRPRLLTREQAAIYCGVSGPTFSVHCPVRPISLGPGKRLERYDIHSLDRWIDTLSGVLHLLARIGWQLWTRNMTVVRVRGIKRYRQKAAGTRTIARPASASNPNSARASSSPSSRRSSAKSRLRRPCPAHSACCSRRTAARWRSRIWQPRPATAIAE